MILDMRTLRSNRWDQGQVVYFRIKRKASFRIYLDFDEDDISKRWEEWIANFDRFIFIKDVKKDNLKINYLLFLGGTGVDKVYQPVKMKPITDLSS
ncbi:unnamed protein product [Brachionus calyciflorus]|uniref:Uncharacterized protein n=1 Tax=Brachionus calyciflorus TaxID=104777 RepID=A0A814BPD2_9BILA|nr:unnamed protein product [Brachionus calyciflorus]